MLDLLIRNGEVVTPQGVGRWAVGVKGEQIAYVGMDDPSMQAGRTVDAVGKIVVPGGIEPHAHLDIFDLTNPDSGKSTLGPEEDTRGMAFGGTTTHLDFCFVEPSMEITKAIEASSFSLLHLVLLSRRFVFGFEGKYHVLTQWASNERREAFVALP